MSVVLPPLLVCINPELPVWEGRGQRSKIKVIVAVCVDKKKVDDPALVLWHGASNVLKGPLICELVGVACQDRIGRAEIPSARLEALLAERVACEDEEVEAALGISQSQYFSVQRDSRYAINVQQVGRAPNRCFTYSQDMS